MYILLSNKYGFEGMVVLTVPSQFQLAIDHPRSNLPDYEAHRSHDMGRIELA